MKYLLFTAALLSLALPARAQDKHQGHAIPMATGSARTEDAATKALRDSHHQMMEDMNIKTTGNPDKDFVAMMIPHHQGAVDMAKVELKFGKDPELRKLAQEIVAAQEKEIAFMKAWQKKHP